MGYFSLTRRVAEVSGLEPKALTWFYRALTRAPGARAIHRRCVIQVLAQGVTHGVALDLGAGPGLMTLEIAQRLPGLHLIGLDLAAHMVEAAHRRAKRIGLDGRGFWPQADGHFLPFADDSFDLVFSSFALHHWRDPLAVLNEVARVLKPEGRYFIADVCREVTLWQRLFAYLSIPVVSLPFGSYWGYGGYYESVRAGYTRNEARALLRRSVLPPGEIKLDSTWFMPILTIASK
ncbi:MAG: class I SAM-dependent methyltransferase [Anaerolineae bacterium]